MNIRRLLVHTCVVSILLYLPLSQAETIMLASGQEMHGKIKGFSNNGLKFQSDKYYVLDLDFIADGKVDESISGQLAGSQRANIDRLFNVIDREKHQGEVFGKKIRQLLFDRKYEELGGIANALMTSGQRYPSGKWKIADFYIQLKSDIESRDIAGYLKRIGQVEDWKREVEGSVPAAILLMGLHRDLAWAYRGSGSRDTVSTEGGKNSIRNLTKVIEMGSTLRSAGVNDPMLYVYLISAANAAGAKKTSVIGLAQESLSKFPYFYQPLKDAMYAMLPRWGAESGMMERYAEEISTSRDGVENDVLYYQLVTTVVKFIQGRGYVNYNLNWARTRRGFEEFSNRFATVDRDLHWMAKLAAMHGDQTAAKEYFSRTDGEWNHYAIDVWQQPELLEHFQSWASQQPSPEFSKIIQSIMAKNFSFIADYLGRFFDTGGDINRRDVYGNSILHLLIEYRQFDLAKEVIAAGADVNQMNGLGLVPLHLAAQNGSADISSVLIRNGAKTDLTIGNYGTTALHIAASNGFADICNILTLVNSFLVNVKDSNLDTALHFAVKNGHYEAVKTIMSASNYKHDAQNIYGDTPLHNAVERGHDEIVKLLVSSNENRDIRNLRNHTPLSYAREQGFTDLVLYLQQQNAEDSVDVISDAHIAKAREIAIKASKFSNQKEYKKSQELYLASLELNPNSFHTYYALALNSWQYGGDPAKADEYIRRSIQLNPSNAENYYIAGRINHALKKPEEYKSFFQKYVALAPDTYNTKDLVKNYSSYLTDTPKKPKKETVGQMFSLGTVQSQIIIAAVLLLLVLVVVRSRQRNKVRQFVVKK